MAWSELTDIKLWLNSRSTLGWIGAAVSERVRAEKKSVARLVHDNDHSTSHFDIGLCVGQQSSVDGAYPAGRYRVQVLAGCETAP